jgi:alpha-glucosidase (family GH31 glycosyl hydrolase)
MLSIGLSGGSILHTDIGGYTMVEELGYTRSKDLLLRWMEMSAFADTIFRSHVGSKISEKEWQVNSNAEVGEDF